MLKETPELITECWQLLIEYIPRRDQADAAEELFQYLNTVLSKEELEAISDMDCDLADAYTSILKEEDNENSYDEDEETCELDDYER